MTDTCLNTNDFNGRTNIRILSIFMILLSSAIGTFFPLLSTRYSYIRLPPWCFFLAKFFGSGVIVATAFIHLLEPASDALGDPCLGGTFADYPWAFGICLMSLFFLFFTEIVSHFYVNKAFETVSHSASGNIHSHSNEDDDDHDHDKDSVDIKNKHTTTNNDLESLQSTSPGIIGLATFTRSHDNVNKQMGTIGSNHYDHALVHQDPGQMGTSLNDSAKEQYANQLLAVTILEFGIVFHSVFIGLSLAVSGEEFTTLFIVLIFHQMFEGLGLGTRLAEVPWDKSKRFTPWLMALGFSLTTPIAIAIGLGVRHSFVPTSRRALISNGCFDAISAGILIYTGLVELMAHEFLYSNQFKGENGFKKMISAYICMCFGAGLMALLGKWA
ncbi:uncharacterized protein NDAI_0J01010 [Naumovozyma dairenensis CBS 421]|uniref:Uncharacterized protein n=1 Tax=Naumovozyma dairenensis (strain ATCC 10597 / BCRC 20456 / CBS 421 / NBRC 0211 / NRRL Y-12639) TaxID=1071378 RepID=G0WGR5_NAUDC|nr:hypothetical protein NDAI_0J01010 [Naumovozyma dairenensis CBS 421]CCD26993.1 hypothetical protein NDAI_0J01010 [Naumovozyma dairenensis CBS 421]